MDQREYDESVSPANGKPVKRGPAQNYGRRLNLVCATFPILKNGKIVELKRNPEKRVLGDEWIFFLSEHVVPKDQGSLNALRRGVSEEVNYKFRWDFYDPRDTPYISYEHEKEQLFWSAGLFVIPIRDLRQLRPDYQEILDIRETDMDKVFAEARRKDSIYGRFKPSSFIEKLERHTRHALTLPRYSIPNSSQE